MTSLAIIDQKQVGAAFLGKNPSTPEEEIAVVNAMNTPSNKINDFINKDIDISNVFIEIVEINDKEGEDKSVLPRTILIDPYGESYACTSTGVFNSLKRIFMIYGQPSMWTEPITMTVKQVTTKNGSMLTLHLKNARSNRFADPNI